MAIDRGHPRGVTLESCRANSPIEYHYARGLTTRQKDQYASVGRAQHESEGRVGKTTVGREKRSCPRRQGARRNSVYVLERRWA